MAKCIHRSTTGGRRSGRADIREVPRCTAGERGCAMIFSVWAPAAQTVKLELGGALHAMRRDDRGWWSVEQPAVSGRTRYRFVIDDGEPTPDPRSRWQPDGVHGASCAWDTGGFAQRERSAFRQRRPPEAAVYGLHAGTLTAEGRCRAAMETLRHLRDLGVPPLELLPLAT